MNNEPVAVLLAEDEGLLRDTLAAFLRDEGFAVTTAADGEEALALLHAREFAVLVTDLQMPKRSGLDLIREARACAPATIPIVITGYATIETAVEAMRQGAYDYLTKPVINRELLLVIRQALAQRDERQQLELYRYRDAQAGEVAALLGEAPALQAVRAQIARVAASDATVLIRGESGTGKEVLAQLIHRASARARLPLIALNCAALPAALLESDLFGHEQGAFTGAVAEKQGLLERADGGSVLLDEIGEMGLELQARLLRVLEEKQFRRVGGTRVIRSDVRFLAATNRALEEAVAQQQFRADLYYRLNVITMTLPPLRERGDDVVLLAEQVLARLGVRYKRTVTFAADVPARLRQHHWPGNVRELQNAIERAFVLCAGATIDGSMLLPATAGNAVPGVPAAVDCTRPLKAVRQELVDGFENNYLTCLMREHGGNLTHAAAVAGLSRLALREKLQKHGLRAADTPGT